MWKHNSWSLFLSISIEVIYIWSWLTSAFIYTLCSLCNHSTSLFLCTSHWPDQISKFTICNIKKRCYMSQSSTKRTWMIRHKFNEQPSFIWFCYQCQVKPTAYFECSTVHICISFYIYLVFPLIYQSLM